MPKWLQDAKRCLECFIEIMGEAEWHKRRKEIVDYFNAIEVPSARPPSLTDKPNDIYRPYARYTDWIAWYMYLVENQGIRPACDEPHQSARILPVFASLGSQMESLRKVKGVQSRFEELLISKNNQADSTLFELLVAACYCKNGWSVEFLRESKAGKTPDMFVNRGNDSFYVECKRMSKITDYSEIERQEWLKRWRNLVVPLSIVLPPVHFDVTFHIEVAKTDPNILADIFSSVGGLKGKSEFYSNQGGVTMIARPIDMQRITNHFNQYDVRMHSPQMIQLLAGSYSPLKGYTHRIVPTGFVKIGPNDGLHCCNTFLDGIAHACSAEWKCIAQESFLKKAKDIKKNFSKATSQIPDNCPGIVHVGYETLEARMVEFLRQERISRSLADFDCGSKSIELLYIHALQCLPGIVESFECAETTLIFKPSLRVDPETVLPNDFLLEQDSTQSSENTHWYQDRDMGRE